MNKEFDDSRLRAIPGVPSDCTKSFRIEKEIENVEKEEKVNLQQFDNELSMTFYGQSKSKSDLPNGIKKIIIDDNYSFHKPNSMPLGINEIKQSISQPNQEHIVIKTYIMKNSDLQFNDSLHSIDENGEKPKFPIASSPRNINIRFNNDENIKKQKTNLVGIPKVLRGNNGILIQSPMEFDIKESNEFETNSSMNSTAKFGNYFDSHIKNFNISKFSPKNSLRSKSPPINDTADKQKHHFQDQITGTKLQINNSHASLNQHKILGPIHLQNLHQPIDQQKELLPEINIKRGASPREGSPPGTAGRIQVLPIPLGQKGEMIDFSTMKRSISPKSRSPLHNDFRGAIRVFNHEIQQK